MTSNSMKQRIAAAKPLLDFLAKYESRGDYNTVWGGIKRRDHPPKPLVTMTIREVLAWQDSIDARYMSEAAGRYQIMEDTLRGLRGDPDFVYDKTTQDLLGYRLLRRRGLDRYLAGEISKEKFANAVAREWASMPVVTGPQKGRSYYAGDGLNKAHASVGGFLSAIEKVKRHAVPPLKAPSARDAAPRKPAPATPRATRPQSGGWAAFARMLGALFSGGKS